MGPGQHMHILLVAYYFPPLSGGGSQRPAAWAEHLRRRGHRVVVLTHTYDRGRRTGDVVRVHDPSHNRHRRGLRHMQWAALRGVVEVLNRCGHPASVYAPWRRAAVAAGHRLVAAERPDLVVATYPPVETLEVGLALSRRHDLPLVADLRDGLLFEPIESRRLAAYPCVRRSYAALETAVAERAAAITCALPLVASDLAERYHLTTTHPLPNTFDPADFADLPQVELGPGQVHLVHCGGFAASDAGCDIAPFAAALAAMPELGRRLRVHQVGRLAAGARRLLAPLVAAGVVVDHGEVDRATSLAFQRRADVLLLITSTRRGSVTPGKLFEYLGAGRPILALTRATFAAELIAATGAGWLVDPADPAAISARLAALAAGDITLQPNRERVTALAVDAHVDRLEAILAAAANATGARLYARTVR